jgi:predicted RNA-binding Zn ribbon-like protein
MRTTVIAHDFEPDDFIGGDAALDFVNTVAGRDHAAIEPARDWVDSYARLLEWARLAELLPHATLSALASLAKRKPKAAALALGRAKQLREAMYEITRALIAGAAPAKPALALLREHWLVAVKAHDLKFGDGRVMPKLRQDASDLDLIAAMAAWHTVENVFDAPPNRLRMCQGPNCAWVFVDTSKSGRRCWCDMKVCGNAAKARRFNSKAR